MFLAAAFVNKCDSRLPYLSVQLLLRAISNFHVQMRSRCNRTEPLSPSSDMTSNITHGMCGNFNIVRLMSKNNRTFRSLADVVSWSRVSTREGSPQSRPVVCMHLTTHLGRITSSSRFTWSPPAQGQGWPIRPCKVITCRNNENNDNNILYYKYFRVRWLSSTGSYSWIIYKSDAKYAEK